MRAACGLAVEASTKGAERRELQEGRRRERIKSTNGMKRMKMMKRMLRRESGV